MTRILFRAPIHDMETCYKMMAKEVVDQITIESSGFELEPEITAKVLRLGYGIVEVPISYAPRSQNQRKLNMWTDGRARCGHSQSTLCEDRAVGIKSGY